MGIYRRTDKGNWHATWMDHTGKQQRKSTGTSVKRVAEQILASWQSEAAKRRSGMIDPIEERIRTQRQREIADHIDEWYRSLESAGTVKYADRQEMRVKAVVEHAGWKTALDITPESVDAFAESLRRSKRANSTIGHYIGAARQFSRWLYRTDRLDRDPLKVIKKPNPKADRRLRRRMLLPDEWPWLRDASGDRRIIYHTAIETGLRANELRSLKRAQIQLDREPPYVLVESGSTKNKKTARQFITPKLAMDLMSWAPHSRTLMFELPSEYDLADVLRADLATARSNWLKRSDADDGDAESDFLCPVNDAGESFDFHALRHTCGAWLAIQGVHVTAIKEIMRHSSITLTVDQYGHLLPGAEPDAIAKLGALMS